MLILIHGDDTVAVRKALEEYKTKYADYEKVFIDGAGATLTEIVTASDSPSLFAKEKLIIVENFLNGLLTKQKEEILGFLNNREISVTVIFCEQKEISKATLKKYFSKAKVISCMPPAVLFRFLDAIGEKPATEILSMFQQLLHGRDGEFIFSMLIRQWRNLIIATDLGEAGFTGMPSWQAYKFIKQAHYFNLKELIFSYRQLLSMDLKIKSGMTPYTLNNLLDIFFVSLYYKN